MKKTILIAIISSFLVQSAFAVDCSDVATWNSNTTYFAGERVQYQNTRFTAAHWTQGNTPDRLNPWGPWRDPQACTGDLPPEEGGFVSCTIDVSNVGETCGAKNPTTCDGADIAQNYALWPNPYQCYVCAPGVTLLKGSRCELDGVNLVWNSTNEQCILNGQGYPMEPSHTCSNGHYTDGITPESYKTLVSDWYRIATTKGSPVFQPNAGADAYVVDVTLENGQQIKAAMSMGHGVLDGKCGSTFLIKRGNKYVLLLQTDVRSWSLELSPGANTWLDPSNMGGTCIIPEVRKIDASFIINQF